MLLINERNIILDSSLYNDIDICPICLDLIITHYTICNHGYCKICYNRINICAICRMVNCKKKTCKDYIYKYIKCLFIIISILILLLYIYIFNNLLK
jgi:hypothetical protein